MGDVAYRQDAVEKRHYAQYILTHHDSWFSFAKKNGRNIDVSDLILVTGCDKTSDWACAAFSKTSKSASASLQVGGFVQGGLRVWGRWEHEGSVFSNEGPRSLVPPTQPDIPANLPENTSTHSETSWTSLLKPLKGVFQSPQDAESPKSSGTPVCPLAPSNQCVFLRGYRVCDRVTWLWKRKLQNLEDGFDYLRKPILKSKKAIENVTSPHNYNPGQGPSGGPSGSSPDGGSGFESSSTSQPVGSSQANTSGSSSQTYQASAGSSSAPTDSEFSELDEELPLSLQSSLEKACWNLCFASD